MSDESLFHGARALAPAERAAYLEAHCADSEARKHIEGLLNAHEAAAGGVLDQQPTTLPPSNQTAPTVIADKYRLVELIGEGGMGAVYLAHQSKPMKRNVAVKLIKAGMDSRQVLARFDAERQALAVMDHPNIAKVLDGGLHDGRPFFIMELVKGVPITEYCDAHKLTPKERLELFLPVCQAIQHAHQKGIIHRDIKPSNVLIALYDDAPVPKVIDFGVAKATGATLTEETIVTGIGGPGGTPQYMSPEQASLNNLDIDTRSDVYALGVLLYELLTGSPPFSKKDLEQKGLLEILRVIREDEPPKPSTRLSTADALPSLAAQRGTEPAKLTKLLKKELDWIVMKALEKNRAQRYESASALARDVRHFLDDEPIDARPPSIRERMARWKRRHPRFTAAYTAGMLMGYVVLLLGITLYFTNQRAVTSEYYREMSQNQSAAYAQALHFFGNSLVANSIENSPEQTRPIISAALAHAGERLEKQIANPAAREIVYRQIARSYESLKEDDKAELFWHRLNATDQTSLARRELGECLTRQNKFAEAEQVLRDALQIALADKQKAFPGDLVLGVWQAELESTAALASLLATSRRAAEAADLLRPALDRALVYPSDGYGVTVETSGLPFLQTRKATFTSPRPSLMKYWMELAQYYETANRADEAAYCRSQAQALRDQK